MSCFNKAENGNGGHAVVTKVNAQTATIGAPHVLTGNSYLDSPKGAGGKKAQPMKVRRRLSVVGGSTLDGISDLGSALGDQSGEEKTSQQCQAAAQGPRPGKIHHVSKKGYAEYNPRKVNQDSIVNFTLNGFTFLGALDGHGEQGHKVSQYLVRDFQANITAQIKGGKLLKSDDPEEIAQKMWGVLEEAEAFLNKGGNNIETNYSGTTMTIGCLYTRPSDGSLHLTSINSGDSRLTLGCVDSKGILKEDQVTIDHKPDLPEEKARIEAKGGRVFAIKYHNVDPSTVPARVWLGNQDVPGLAMSRSLGDKIAHVAGVISEPEVFQTTIQSHHKYLVVATDGLWEFLSNMDVLEVVHTHKTHGITLEAICERLLKISTEKWMNEEHVVDDTSMAICVFEHSS